MARGRGGGRAAIALGLAALVWGAVRPAAGEPPGVAVEGDRVTLRVSRASAASVVAEIARASGAELRGRVASSDDVSVTLDALSHHEALRRVLGEQDFTLVYGADGRIRTIELLGVPDPTPGPQPAIQARAPSPETGQGVPPALADLLQRRAPVASDGRLARSLGSEPPTFAELMRAAVMNGDEKVRRAAMRHGTRMIEHDEALTGALLAEFTRMGDAPAALLVRNMVGDRAREFLASAAEEFRNPTLRKRTLAILNALPSDDG